MQPFPKTLALFCATSFLLTPQILALPEAIEEEAARSIVMILRHSREILVEEYGALADQVAAHLPTALDEILEIMRARSLPELLEGQGTQRLSTPQEDILLAAFVSIDPALLLAARVRFISVDDTAERRTVGMRLLGIAGVARDVPLLLEEALPPEADPFRGSGHPALSALPRPLVRSFTAALTELLKRDPQTLNELRRVLLPLPEPLLVACVRAVGRARDPRGQQLILDLMPLREKLLPLLLSQVPLLGLSGDRILNESLALHVRASLNPADPGLCRAASLAVAALHDSEAVDKLIALLDEENEGLRQNAHFALRELCDKGFPPNSQIWKSWWQSEAEWLGAHSYRCRQALLSSETTRILSALRDLEDHALFGKHFETELVELLSHARTEVREQACGTIRKLRARVLAHELLPLLHDLDGRVQDAAAECLADLTGLKAEPTSKAWRAALRLQD